MKKNYITPEIKVIQLEALCNEGLNIASVHRADLKGECISKFDVVNEDATKTEYKDLWGESNSNKWGDD
ncbi:hypothetical protein [Segatella hominis]|uniref:Uncharacterized protein n=1 Tax=Segatella hominis TaxID=2518605 RepID=A0A4Y8VG92_9BACT|nr:hypothetical protein [Segatella hominis]TFH78774.1 hypothetical protein EXN75_11265 [Segatella hominis]